ncbi:MAG: hypothetical protein WBG11_04725 [Methylocella sp.]
MTRSDSQGLACKGAEISQRRFGRRTVLVLGKSIYKARDRLDAPECPEHSNHTRQGPGFHKPHEELEYARLAQTRQGAGCRIDHRILADALDRIGNFTWGVEELDQNIISLERRQRLHGEASRLEKPAWLSLEQHRTKGWDRLPAASNDLDEAPITIMKRSELLDCLLDVA